MGKSTVAANLAIALLRELRSKVLLLDLDAQSCADQSIITGLRPTKNITEVCEFQGALSNTSLQNLTTQHASGLAYIPAVIKPNDSLQIAAPLLSKQLRSLSQFYNFIICDLGNQIQAPQLAVIEQANLILPVTTPEVLAVNQTQKLLHELMAATVPADFFYIVVNKWNKSSLNPQIVSKNLQRPVIGCLPQDDITVYNSLQRSTPFTLSQVNTPITKAYFDLVRKITGGVLQKLQGTQKPKLKVASSSSDADNPITLLKIQIHKELIKEMDLKKDLSSTKNDPKKEQELKTKTQKVISQLCDKLAPELDRPQRSQVIKQVVDEALGLGPLEELLGDPGVSEVMVNGAKQIFIEKGGKLTLSPTVFTSNLQLRNVIERIMTPLGRRIDEKTPYQDARLQDGSRVNAVIEPLAIDGPSITIRKFPSERLTMKDQVERFGSATAAMANLLRICVEQGLNVIISGGTGSGKTTLLNCLSGFIPANERIVTVEDAAELQLKQTHVVRLETRPANIEGSGAVTIRDLVRNSLRMRPDRIVVGECRDGAALDMLSAMNTGHDGSMTTVHSNNPREAISRLETLCLMAGMELPVRAIREQIAGAVDLIVQISRLQDGSRKIISITEVVGMQGDTVTLQEIFRFKKEGFDKNRKITGQFQAMGLIPTFIEEFEQRGIKVPRDLFTTSTNTKDIHQNKAATPQKPSPQPTKPISVKAHGSKPPKPSTVRPASMPRQGAPKPAARGIARPSPAAPARAINTKQQARVVQKKIGAA